MSVVYQPVKDRVSQRRIGDPSVPLVNGDLCRDESGGGAEAVIEDFENIFPKDIGTMWASWMEIASRIQSSRTSRLQRARERRVAVREPSERTWERVCSKRAVRW